MIFPYFERNFKINNAFYAVTTDVARINLLPWLCWGYSQTRRPDEMKISKKDFCPCVSSLLSSSSLIHCSLRCFPTIVHEVGGGSSNKISQSFLPLSNQFVWKRRSIFPLVWYVLLNWAERPFKWKLNWNGKFWWYYNRIGTLMQYSQYSHLRRWSYSW